MASTQTHHARLDFLQRITEASYSQLFLMWIVINTVFAGVYFALSIVAPAHGPNFDPSLTTAQRLFDSFYFSIVTATSTGYGDILPLGFSKILAMVQCISALLVFAVLVGKLVSQRQDLALHEVHRMTFEGIFYQIRGGLFTVRKDFDTLMQKADQKELFNHGEWSTLSTAYLQAQNLIEQIPDMYNGLGNSLHTVDLKRERLLFESIHRTLTRLNTMLEHFDAAKIDWINHVESARELHAFVQAVDTIMPLWRQRSPFHEVKEFEDIRSLAELMHKEMKWKIEKK